MLRMLSGFTIALSMILLMGCDPDWPKHGRSSKVVGEVLLDGEALVDAKVIFLPKDGNVDGLLVRSAYGVTDAQGMFKLKTSGDSEKVKFGRYTVIVSKLIYGPKLKRELGRADLVPEEYNLSSTLVYDLSSQEAFDRPVFELTSD